jgi:hypothetical protein
MNLYYYQFFSSVFQFLSVVVTALSIQIIFERLIEDSSHGTAGFLRFGLTIVAVALVFQAAKKFTHKWPVSCPLCKKPVEICPGNGSTLYRCTECEFSKTSKSGGHHHHHHHH